VYVGAVVAGHGERDGLFVRFVSIQLNVSMRKMG
jgi:hypothetical protein